MPTYTYKCFHEDKENKNKCEHQFDIVQSIKDDKLKECPVCHNQSLERLISAPMVVYKGAGWFKTSGSY